MITKHIAAWFGLVVGALRRRLEAAFLGQRHGIGRFYPIVREHRPVPAQAWHVRFGDHLTTLLGWRGGVVARNGREAEGQFVRRDLAYGRGLGSSHHGHEQHQREPQDQAFAAGFPHLAP